MAGATSRISKVLVTGPLAPFAEDYRRELRDRGYTERSAVNQLRQVARFSGWLQASQLSVSELSTGRVGEFLGWQRAVGAVLRGRAAVVSPLLLHRGPGAH